MREICQRKVQDVYSQGRGKRLTQLDALFKECDLVATDSVCMCVCVSVCGLFERREGERERKEPEYIYICMYIGCICTQGACLPRVCVSCVGNRCVCVCVCVCGWVCGQPKRGGGGGFKVAVAQILGLPLLLPITHIGPPASEAGS